MAIDLAHVGGHGIDPDEPHVADFRDLPLKFLQVFMKTKSSLAFYRPVF